jgi:hypothetical protein
LVDGGAGYNYFNPAGWEFSGVGGLTYNFVNLSRLSSVPPPLVRK